MIKIITLTSACAIGLLSGFAQEAESIKTMHQLLQEISDKRGNMIVAQFDQGDVAGLLSTIPEYAKLTKIVARNSDDALENFQAIAPNKASRIVLLYSAEELAPEDYLAFSVKSFDLLMERQIQNDEFLRILLMSPTKKQWFLSYNYQNPHVIEFLSRVRLQFASDAKISALVDFILSGKAKKRDEILRKENRSFATQPIDLLSKDLISYSSHNSSIQQGNDNLASRPETPQAIIESLPQSKFPIVPVGILVLASIGAAVLVLRRKSR